MKKLTRIAALFFALTGIASASCPPNMPYGCQVLPNGHQRCGCGY
jgi:hypothetical protein